ncbi:hypothetical protein [Bacillus pseudomycoides]|uniref:hypothetical protein n=1 Tax=Bacillus pseudomycoides TaxID=64104 RepID=UPI001FB46ACF|nr:hypothetical protein [Bacillus pseudomycoides]
MLDINFIRRNPDLVQKAANNKGIAIDIQEVLQIDKERRVLLDKLNNYYAERNKLKI